MASYTPNLNLLMKDPVTDGADTFNIETMLNENWEKIDRQVLRAMAAAAAYDAGTTYQQGDFCTQGGLLYRANQAIAQPEAWTAGHWTAISITDVIRGLTAEDVGAVPTSQKGTAGGVATLGSDGQMPYAQTPHLTGNVTLYVDAASGNDENPGTPQAPFATIQAAINSIPKNLGEYRATIFVEDGTYQGDVIISGFYGGNVTSSYLYGDIEIKAVNRLGAIINGNIYALQFSMSVYLDGLDIRCSEGNGITSRGNIYIGNCKTTSSGYRSLHCASGILRAENSEFNGLGAYGACSDGVIFLTKCTIKGGSVGVVAGSSNPAGTALMVLGNCTVTAPTKAASFNYSLIFENGVKL